MSSTVGVVLALFAGFVAGRLVWLMLRPVLAAPVFERTNFRGLTVPVGAGVAIAVAVVGVASLRVAVAAAGVGTPGTRHETAAVLALTLGLCLLGLFDDLAGTSGDRGFGGHLRALAKGRLTTGALKLFGGAAVAVIAVDIALRSDDVMLVADAALVALAANLANLFDRAPGRVLKVGALAFLALAVAAFVAGASAGAGASASVVPVAVVVGAALALLLDDLHERLMLGDAGANVLGGALGLGVVMAFTPKVRLVALVTVLGLNVVSEVVSFSRVIERVPPLRVLDRMGRRP